MKDWINKVITDNYDKLCRIANSYYNGKDCPSDILQESLVAVLSKSDKDLLKFQNDENYLLKTIVTIIKLNTISRTSQYQNKYNKMLIQDPVGCETIVNLLVDDSDEYDSELDDKLQALEKAIDSELDFLERNVVKEAMLKSLNKISVDCEIPITSLWKVHRRAKNKLKDKLNGKARSKKS